MEIKKIIVDEIPQGCKYCTLDVLQCTMWLDVENRKTQRHPECPLISENDVVITHKKTTP